jgi:Cof subfamily protein (haloacid dehalogenase superfamily)
MNSTSVKMIVTDLDDTLLRSDKTMSERSKSAIRQCRALGKKTVYATGRGDDAKALVSSDLFDGCVYMNGATAYRGDLLIYKKHIPVDKVRVMLTATDNAGFKIAAEAKGKHYANFNVSERWPYIHCFEYADFATLNIEAEKVYAIVDKPQVTELLEKHLAKGLHLYVSRDGLAMVMHEEAVKSRAVAALAEHWRISMNEVVAFGDDSNDIDMLKHCGIGVAMGNALDEVKITADHVCDTNDNDGVAKWLEDNVL